MATQLAGDTVSSMVEAEEVAFLNGYLFRVMVDMLRSNGTEASGFYDFYKARVEQERTALSGYDRILLSYIGRHFEPSERAIVHAGIGLGTLASALAVAGFQVHGIERDPSRFDAATRVRAAVIDMWPEAAERYKLIVGSFPAVLVETTWIGSRAVLVFTNCGSGWPEELVEEVISLFPQFGDVILDARLFGTVRDLPEERADLIARIEANGFTAVPIPETNPIGAYYYHIQRPEDRP
jgi:hypothetical protein